MERHPCRSSLDIVQKNKMHTLHSNIFPKNGWIQIRAKPKTDALPPKSGHSMIRFGSDIYSVGGVDQATQYDEQLPSILFLKIKICKEGSNYFYTWSEIKIPEHCMAVSNPNIYGMPIRTTIHKWNGKLILFGGYEAFENLLVYYSKSQKWEIYHAEPIKFATKENDDDDDDNYVCADNHYSALILNDKLFVYSDGLFCNLDLQTKKWQELKHLTRETK